MISTFIHFAFITCFLVLQLKTPIYYSKRVFTFNVEIKKPSENYVNKKIYLTTFDEYWPFDEQKWIGWTDKFQNIQFKETGVGETHAGIFLHPPRKNEFAILEFSPFPIVNYPLSVGKEWTWSLEIGTQWAKRAGIKNFDKVYNFVHTYKVTGDTIFLFNGIMINCFVIEANCISPYGKSRLVACFNEVYGFVKLDYLNMDNSRFTFSLERIQNLEEVLKSPIFTNQNLLTL
ncbi:MAG: hypothetical protein RBT74_12425 [Tenuifilaceae bacterium]|jgi:hypothetical protein|nr:hypothetical protein [Tenuifilaceae bacterium]